MLIEYHLESVNSRTQRNGDGHEGVAAYLRNCRYLMNPDLGHEHFRCFMENNETRRLVMEFLS